MWTSHYRDKQKGVSDAVQQARYKFQDPEAAH